LSWGRETHPRAHPPAQCAAATCRQPAEHSRCGFPSRSLLPATLSFAFDPNGPADHAVTTRLWRMVVNKA
jgi:hypothetical protein